MARSMADERADMALAFQNAATYHAELAEIYKWFLPYRQSTQQRAPSAPASGVTEGASRTDHIFDGTGVAAAFNFAGTMVADWMPVGSEFFKLEAGPFVLPDARQQLNIELGRITEIAHSVLPRVRLTAHEMFTDVFAGTGAMFLAAGDDRQLVRSQCVPVNEIAMEEGPFGDVWSVWWRRNYKARHLRATWPNGEFSSSLRQIIKDKPNDDVEIIQSTRYDPTTDRWHLKVYASNDGQKDAIIFEEQYYASPWLTPRFFKVPGEAFGRGLAHLALPFVKTANKTVELALRAAAFAIMGIWMRRNDGVFNPDTAVFKPLQFWTVASTGGTLGPSLQRLPVPQDFDISTIVLKDQRDQINKATLNDELPELQDSVRSPTEIAARLRRMAKTKGGAGGRIALEFIAPLAQRTIDILETKGKLPTNLTLDEMQAKVTITSPAAAAQRADKVQRAIDWMQMIVGLTGMQGLALVSKVEELLPEVGRWMGNDEQFMRSDTDKKELLGLIAQMVAAQQKAGAQPQPIPEPTGAQYANGAM